MSVLLKMPCLEVGFNGKWFDPSSLAGMGMKLELAHDEREEGTFLTAAFYNESGGNLHFDGFRFRFTGGQHPLLASAPGNLRVFHESWLAVGPCGSFGYGEKDFHIWGKYLPSAVANAGDYREEPNRFHGEQMTMIRDIARGETLLFGFVTSADAFTRCVTTLSENGTEVVLYSDGDGVLLENGETARSEELLVSEGRDSWSLLEKFGESWGRKMNARIAKEIPSGWCSWYYYFSKITEADSLENARFIHEHSQEYPLEYFQIDDGYQRRLGDWLLTDTEKFPRGLEFLASEIRKNGLKPGIWLAPFLVDERSELFHEHPEWMLRDKEGKILIALPWRGANAAVLDATHPGAQQWLSRIFSTLSEWGYEYFKLDFMMYECIPGACYHDPKATRAQVLRRGMECIRGAAGEKSFLLGGTMLLGPAIGIVDGERTGTDITPCWRNPKSAERFDEAPEVPNVCRNIINRTWMHRRLWINDPDVLIVRKSDNQLTENEVLLWAEAIRLCGGMLMMGDRLSVLEPGRAALAQSFLKEFDAYDTRPLDFMERRNPGLWLGKKRSDGTLRLSVFNTGETTEERVIPMASIDPEKTVALRELSTGNPIHAADGCFAVTVLPHHARTFEVIHPE